VRSVGSYGFRGIGVGLYLGSEFTVVNVEVCSTYAAGFDFDLGWVLEVVLLIAWGLSTRTSYSRISGKGISAT
jgi:hypothetical protein